jgi:hypothetical protein
MPRTESKTGPSGIPSVPAELQAAVQEALSNPRARDRFRIELLIDGGNPEERYVFHFKASGRGKVECHMSCRMSGRQAQAVSDTMPPGTVERILRTVEEQKLLESRSLLPRVPPCSLIGRLTIGDGKQTYSAMFMADSEQASIARYEMPPALAKVLELIYSVAADILRMENVRP